jgi:hypothetical protein
MGDVRMITIADLQKQYPTDPPPSARWISSKAKLHKLGKQHGKFFLVREDFIQRYSEIDECQVTEKSSRKTERSHTPTGASSRSGKRTARLNTDPVSEALALARSPKLVPSESRSREHITSASISRLPKRLTTVNG